MQSEIDPKIQAELNKPLIKKDCFSDDDAEFLHFILDLIESGRVDLYRSATLLNLEVYESLNEMDQGKIDLEAVNFLAKIREINDLCEAGYEESFQVENLVHSLRLVKERAEGVSGNVFII